MPSETDELLESIRRLLLVTVFLFGLGVATLGDIAVAVRGYTTGIPSVARITGSAVALTAIVLLYTTVFQATPNSDSADEYTD